ncbi:membrane protein [Mangrovimonas yunxiaonensis]|uniref:Membrane protein n=1 Tax=Mangrovimonas yunxiaonensis TaxID=1197477 RepID=A0A084TLC1_9FLAO|nr:DUF4199 domain-containing protein [Mangrovimonas yunxiaonensis]KFB01507.1 membrane protein [Mangrovimonas yunxiaonensis]MBR9758360.1 DUF4199 domain-containing protein [Algicola sp.]GGH36271.1 hypothetical protein GCM10011364_03430 [Mangrovimonas yunxiaonensis]
MNTSASVSLKYGVLTAVALVGYFLLLKLIGLHQNPWFRLFNGVIMAFGLFMGIKHYKSVSGNQFNYINGFKTGLLTGFWATFIFAAFMAVYMFHLDVEFMHALLKNWFENTDKGGGILIFIILIEGLASTTVLTLTFMQIFKRSTKITEKA